MRQVILPPLRSHVPDVNLLEPKPTWHLPIHVCRQDGIDLDFGPLLIFDAAIVDAESTDYIAKSKRPELTPLAESLTVLRDEGYLTVRDFGSELRAVRHLIDDHTDRIVRDPLPLRSPFLRGVRGYRATLPQLTKAGVSQDNEFMNLSFGMHLLLVKKFGNANPDERIRIEKLLSSRKQRWSKAEIQDVRDVIYPTVTYLYQNLVLSELIEAPFVDVDYTIEMYSILRKMSLLAFNNDAKHAVREIEATRELFSCVIPHLCPASATEMVRLLRSSAMIDFRTYIHEMAESGTSVSRSSYIDLLSQTLYADRRERQAMKWIAWGERLVSLIPGCAPLALAGAEIAGKLLRARSGAPSHTRWMYALLENAKQRKTVDHRDYPKGE